MANQLGFDFFDIKPEQLELSDVRTKKCTCCGATYPEQEPYYRSCTTNKSGDVQYYMAICKKCEARSAHIRYKLYKTAPSPPDNCECCGEHKSKYRHNRLNLDHDHQTGEFRGWLCGACNRGLGNLGDDLEGVLQALAYLKRHYEKD